MITREEFNERFAKLRQAQGDMKNAIDMAFEEAKHIEEIKKNSYEKGVKDGAELAAMHGSDATTKELEKQFWNGVDVGLEKAWEVAKRIFAEMDYDEAIDAFGTEAANDNETFFRQNSVQEAIQKLKAYDDRKKEPTNAQKFVETFGFRPGFETTEAGDKIVFPSLHLTWWDEPYKEPKHDT